MRRENPKGKTLKPGERKYKPLRDIRKVKERGAFSGGQRSFLNRSLGTWQYVGCVVNPKFMRPYFVVGTPEGPGDFYIAVPTTDTSKLEVVGKGNFETSYGEYSLPALHFGAPRIHTVSGVTEKGTGLGTALYTGGCLMGSFLVVKSDNHDNDSSIESEFLREPGCSSGPGASYSASAWWNAASRRGLVDEDEVEGEEEAQPVRETFEKEGSYEVFVDWDDIYEKSDSGWWSIDEEFRDELDEHRDYDVARSIDGEADWDTYETSITSISIEGDLPSVTATFDVENEKGDEAEVEIVFSMEKPPRLHEVNFLNELKEHLDEQAEKELADQLERGFDLVGLPENFGEVTDKTLTEVTISARYASLDIDWEASVEVETQGEGERTEETVFMYPLKNALRDLLILDMNETLLEDYGEYMVVGKRLLEVVLNLDLAEVEDPDVFPLFFGMAESAGATQTQLRQFINRVTLRGDLPRDIGEREYLFDEELGFKPGLAEKGVRVNPDNPDFEAIGEAIYGNLADLD